MKKQRIYELYEEVYEKVIKKFPKYEKYLKDYTFYFGNRKKVFGTCEPKKKVIKIHLPLCLKESKKSVKDTILHEIAHAIDYGKNGKSNHGFKWKKIAKKLGCEPVPCKEPEKDKKKDKKEDKVKTTIKDSSDNTHKGIKPKGELDIKNSKYVLVLIKNKKSVEPILTTNEKIGKRLNIPLIKYYIIGRKSETLNKLVLFKKDTYLRFMMLNSVSK